MATHSIILAWEIPWTEEPGRLESMGLQRVRQDLATKQHLAVLTLPRIEEEEREGKPLDHSGMT